VDAPNKQSFDQLNYANWLEHPETKRHISQLALLRERILVRASQKAEMPNLSESNCRFDLIKASLLFNLIEAIEKNAYEKM
jgi:hypothetical protein